MGRLGAVQGSCRGGGVVRTREEGAGWGRREGRRTEHAPEGAAVGAVSSGSVAPGDAPLRIFVLTGSDRGWLGSPDLLAPNPGASAPNLRRGRCVRRLERPRLLCNL